MFVCVGTDSEPIHNRNRIRTGTELNGNRPEPELTGTGTEPKTNRNRYGNSVELCRAPWSLGQLRTGSVWLRRAPQSSVGLRSAP